MSEGTPFSCPPLDGRVAFAPQDKDEFVLGCKGAIRCSQAGLGWGAVSDELRGLFEYVRSWSQQQADIARCEIRTVDGRLVVYVVPKSGQFDLSLAERLTDLDLGISRQFQILPCDVLHDCGRLVPVTTAPPEVVMPACRSNIWDDQYKLTMGQGAFRLYDGMDAHYRLIDRGATEFPPGFAAELTRRVAQLPGVATTPGEMRFLRGIAFLRPAYVDWLGAYRYDPGEVRAEQDGGRISVDVRGPWYRTIRWEVKLMAMVVELYNEMMGRSPLGDWEGRAAAKARRLRDAGAKFGDFGTRRAFSGDVHERVLTAMKAEAGPALVGTSNLLLAMRLGLTPIGTEAHEWFQAHACMFGARNATRSALRAWADEFGASLGIALTDTFTTEAFLGDFDLLFSKLYDGVRHDSGCPLGFADRIVEHYESLRIDPMTKTIVFSDGLDVDGALRILDHCRGRIKASFGIGTHLTNDVGHPALNIVMKLWSLTARGRSVVHAAKLSDDPGKSTGDPRAIRHAMYELGLLEG